VPARGSHQPPPGPAHAQLQRGKRSGTGATPTFDCGRCIVDADEDVLTLRIEADDVATWQRIEKLIKACLEPLAATST
jgi:hypothetical protein